jgi:outer membrane protein TolC
MMKKAAALLIVFLLLGGSDLAAQGGAVTVTQQPVPGTTTSVNTLNPSVHVEGAFAASASSTDSMPFSGRLTLSDAIKRALAYNLGVIERTQAALQASGRAAIVRSALLPSVVSSARQVRQEINLQASGIQFPPIPGVSFPTVVGPFNVVDLRAAVSQTVVDLTAWSTFRASRSQETAARLAIDDARDLVVLATGAGYLQVLASRARVESARAQVETADALLKQTSEQRAVGIVAQVDVNRSQVEALTQRQRLLSLQNDLSKQKISLARLTGLPPDDQFEVSDDVLFAPVPALSVDTAIAEAIANRADLKAADVMLQAATQAWRAARAERLPTVTVDADYGAIGTTLDDARRTFTVRGVVRLPLWDGGRAGGDIAQAEAVVRQHRAEVESLRAEIIADVRRACMDVEAAASQVDLGRTNLETTRQTLDLTRQLFEAGVTDALNVVRAQETVAAANLDYINSVFAHNIAKLSLARAIGAASADLTRFLTVR